MIANDLALKTHIEKVGLLTSEEIRRIQEAYDLSQKDLAVILVGVRPPLPAMRTARFRTGLMMMF